MKSARKRFLQFMKSYNLSVIIPHYNSSELLEKLLSTIPEQKGLEVIVVDDKSESCHVKHILNLQKKYDFVFLKNDTDTKSAGTCRNIGLANAHGKWILFADADDYFTDMFYEYISEYFNSTNDVVFFIPTSIYLETGIEADRHVKYKNILLDYIQDPSQSNELSLRYQMETVWSKMIKKSFIDNKDIKFDEVIASNDVLFSTKVGFFMEQFMISENIIYVVTKNQGSLTTNISKKVFESRLKAKVRYYKFLKSHLTECQFVMMNISLSGWLYDSLKYGFFYFIKTVLYLNEEKVKILDERMFNMKFIITKLQDRYQKNKTNKQYEV